MMAQPLLARLRSLRYRNIALLVPFFVFLALLPSISTEYDIHILVISSFFAISAAALDIFNGYVGYHNFGYALFFGLGAYVSAFAYKWYGIPAPLTPLIAGAVVALAALAVGLPTLRLRGAYFAMAMIALSETMQLVFTKAYEVTGGEDGFRIPSIPMSTTDFYYLSIALAIFITLLLYFLGESKLGLIFKMIREDPVAAESLGVDTARYKVLAFVISAVPGGIAGSLFAYYQSIATPDLFSLTLTADLFYMQILGGAGTIIGPAIGAYILRPLSEILRPFMEVRYLIYSGFIIFVILSFPEGLWGILSRLAKRLRTMLAKH